MTKGKLSFRYSLSHYQRRRNRTRKNLIAPHQLEKTFCYRDLIDFTLSFDSALNPISNASTTGMSKTRNNAIVNAINQRVATTWNCNRNQIFHNKKCKKYSVIFTDSDSITETLLRILTIFLRWRRISHFIALWLLVVLCFLYSLNNSLH